MALLDNNGQSYLLKNARLVDPQVGLDEVADLLIADGKIAAVGQGLEAPDAIEQIGRASCRERV